ncbi:MAG: hypothetical protein ACD_80C00112G0001, partial [uncultured bacterium (gcode 4)]
MTTNHIVRLNTDGTKDTSFNNGGASFTISYNGGVRIVKIQSDGKILVGGYLPSYNWTPIGSIVHLNTDGSMDTGFNIGGIWLSDANWNTNGYGIDAMVVQNDDKAIVGGTAKKYNLVGMNSILRINTDGTRDPSFDIWNSFDRIVYDQAFQNDGKVIAGGAFAAYNWLPASRIVRLNADGNTDTSFNVGWSWFDSNYVTSLAIQSDGKIVAWGYFAKYNWVTANNIARLNSDGTRDTGFTTSFGTVVNALAIQSNGKILVGGWWYTLVSLNTDGSIDTWFNVGGAWLNAGAVAIKIQSDGKILIGGGFTTYNWVPANRIIRLNTDGTRDVTFGSNGCGNGSVTNIDIQNDGKIVAWWVFAAYNWTTVNNLVRINTDGTRDTSFSGGVWFNSNVVGMAVQSDGKIIAWGYFTTYNWTPVNYVVRINANGSIDTGFDVGNWFIGQIDNIKIQSGGKIFIGGDFSTYNWVAAWNLISFYGTSPLIGLPNTVNAAVLASTFTGNWYTVSGGNFVWSNPFSLELTNGYIPLGFNIKNQGMRLSLPTGIQFKKADNTTNYNGTIWVPVPKTLSSLNSQQVIAAFALGSTSESLKLVGWLATLLIPTPTKNTGDAVDVLYSNDNSVSRYHHTTTAVIYTWWIKWVLFTTDHFTDFAIVEWISTGSFVINNDTGTTLSTSVTLNITGAWLTDMSFSNDNATRSSPVSFAITYAWTLSAGTGTKTVWAKFNGGTITTSDDIFYDGTVGTGCIWSSCADITLQIIA